MPADLNAARAAYQASPGSLPNYSDDAFVQWWAQNMGSQDISQSPQDFALLTALADNGNHAASQALTAGGYQQQPAGTGTGGGGPLEQQILTTVLPNLLGQINSDTAGFDGNKYFQTYPDVAAAYNGLPAGATPGTKSFQGHDVTANQFAEYHYQTYGQNEGRQAFHTGNSGLSIDLQNQANQAYGNLKDVLKPAIATFNPDGTMTSQLYQSQTKNADQVTADLIASAKTANASQAGALGDSIAKQKAALAAQIATMQGDASQAAADKRAALQDQISQLTAAAAPLAAARTAAAEGQVTGVNLGLEATKDQISADNALGGFKGPSTMTDASLARATIGARNQAAQAVGAASVANATDTRDIGYTGANTGYSIADALASQKQQIGDTGAQGNAALEAALAQGNYSLAAQLAQQIQSNTDTGTKQKANYFDQIFPNSVSAAQALAQLPGQQAQTLQGIIPLGNAGTNNALNMLNWWATGSNNPPTPTATLQQPNNTGNQLSQLGGGLLGSAFQVGNANNWWKTPATDTSGIGGTTSYADFLKNNPNSLAAGGTCWVAREIYGPKDIRWMRFRDWMLTQAPAHFQELYLRAGAKLAEWLRTDGTPEDRASIRSFMDRQITFA